ncbi:major facilitator superfamily multidrug resistance protein [Streptomyces albus]|uniref:Major facilitator superfamily multidrug resistance protein n=1 Tax=Streptomyces albus (strain ATCC 21838 / DSM 41398 / FERM P-419 / JCM 4703 / NBRC 107858) TaxID=1081613 RepID=A0A0B5EGK1_STRA4|nr:major facilitator superfamily multidrug resistance protein [Streptomyces albus]AOU74774.1 major facilitator superfamily multidrug resistance protein [Streptomyces albus]AYN30585.1 major facilitator superfamily multidrug resistance protein [Streptomyces albus]
MTRLVSDAVHAERSSYRAVLAVVVGSTFLSMLGYAGPLGNVVTLAEALGSSQAGATWMLASMSVGLAITLLAVGVTADRIGHRRVFGRGAALFAVASAVCALAQSTPVFVSARIVAGAGAAGMIATGLGLVAAVSEHPGHRATTATGWSAAMGAGIASGPLVTGLLDLLDAWRGFYGLLAFGGLAVWAGTRRLVPQARPPGRTVPSRRFDPVGSTLLTGLLAVVVTALVEVRAGEPATVLALAAVAAVLLGALVVSQRVGTARLVDPRLFTHRPFLGATVAAFGTGIGVIATMSFACTFLVDGLGMSTLQAGALLAAWSGTSAGAALLFARHAVKVSGTVQLVTGLAGVALGLALLTGIGADSGGGRLLPGLTVAGLASGLLNTGLARQAVAGVPVGDIAMGTGANNTARYLGSSIGVSAASIIAAGDLVRGWNQVARLGAAASLACAVLVALLSDRARTPSTAED